LVRVGVVVIGRNEGQRLVACLASIGSKFYPLVYVDSGSTDDSIQIAGNLGADVVPLNMVIPFTAARARNAGLKRLIEKWPSIQYVQFVDGDCVLVDGWLRAAESFLDESGDGAVSNIYNRLCDIEWDTSTGEVLQCGGIAMMRVKTFLGVEGFRAELIAGEEPELCLRLRENGWKIWRLQNEMAWHDANMQYFSQWWKRTLRGGWAYAAVSTLHARSPKRIWHRELLRAVVWGMVLPLLIVAGSFINIATLGLFVVYPVQIARIALRRGAADLMSWRYGAFMTIAKFAEAAGAVKYVLSWILGRKTRLIEYK
jgi:GT2 family glycosyltransferase